MADRVDVLWQCAPLQSSEHCAFSRTAEGWRIDGVAVLPIGDAPGHVEYEVVVDPDWTTDAATAHVASGPRVTRIELAADGGRWTVDGHHRADLDGCVDVDLGWTPATNTLPIRRLDLAVGESADIAAAWLRFPELVVERSVQEYTRLADDRWRYRSGPYDFELVVSADGVVTCYGDDLWQAVSLTS